MGLWRYKCTNCGHNEIEKVMSNDVCRACGRGRYAKFEHLPDAYFDDLKGRTYRLKLDDLKKKLGAGIINKTQYLVLKEYLDRTLPNPKVAWNQIPNSFKDIHDIDGYENEPEVKLIIPEYKQIDPHTIAVRMREKIVDRNGNPISSKK